MKSPTRPLVLAVLAIGVLFTGIGVLDLLRRGQVVPWRSAAWQLVGNWLFAAFVPAIAWLTRRYPVEGGRRLSRLPLHALAAVVMSVTGTAIYALLRLAAQALWGEPFRPSALVTGYLRGSLVLDLTVYMALSGAFHAALFYDSFLHQRLAASLLEVELASSRLRFLRAQLNPHFLFNVLNTAASLVYEEPRTVDRLMGRLSVFLRLVLGASETDEVRLDAELEITRLYVELQRLRFGEKLEVAFELDDGVGSAAVPSLVLQPLVENAIVHGRDPGRTLQVCVRARREGTDLVLEVEDDGRGLTPGAPLVEGVGLANTRARLRLLYRDLQRVDLEERADAGLRVRLRIPLLPTSNWGASPGS